MSRWWLGSFLVGLGITSKPALRMLSTVVEPTTRVASCNQSCGGQHRVHHSCGNRHCPQCQYHQTQQWLQQQLDKQLPGPHFLITFTLPETLRPFIRSHQQVAYAALFKASSHAIKRLAKDERLIGTHLPGFTGILHTWGRQLQYHPHIHYMVPGGGLAKDRTQWLPSRANFFVPVKAFSPIYRVVFTQEMANADLLERIDPKVWNSSRSRFWHQGPAPNTQACAVADHPLADCRHHSGNVGIAGGRELDKRRLEPLSRTIQADPF